MKINYWFELRRFYCVRRKRLRSATGNIKLKYCRAVKQFCLNSQCMESWHCDMEPKLEIWVRIWPPSSLDPVLHFSLDNGAVISPHSAGFCVHAVASYSNYLGASPRHPLFFLSFFFLSPSAWHFTPIPDVVKELAALPLTGLNLFSEVYFLMLLNEAGSLCKPDH